MSKTLESLYKHYIYFKASKKNYYTFCILKSIKSSKREFKTRGSFYLYILIWFKSKYRYRETKEIKKELKKKKIDILIL